MKKLRYIIVALAAASVLSSYADSCNDSCHCENSSHTYLSFRPQFQLVDPIYVSGMRDRSRLKENGWGGVFQAVVFGGKTTKEDHLARYFMPFCQTKIIVDETLSSSIANASQGDVLSSAFNIVTVDRSFRSVVSFEPRQSTVGVGLHYRQSFWCDEDAGRGFWASISFPITHVHNNIGFCENVENDGGGVDTAVPGAVANMRAAFSNPTWNFSRIDFCGKSKTGVADVTMLLGYEWLQCDPCHLEAYIGVLAPTGNRPKGLIMFEPVVGWGGHVGLEMGGSYGIHLWRNDCADRSLRVEMASNGQYLFSRTQRRSFDLKGKPWSRFLPVYIDQAAAQASADESGEGFDPFTGSTPGVNVFTQCVKVRPGYSFNMTSALVYSGCSFAAELGYNVFARSGDCVKLDKPWVEGPALIDPAGHGFTRPIRDITGNFFLEASTIPGSPVALLPVDPTNYQDSIITADDLDLVSAASPCLISNTIYGTVGLEFDTFCDIPAFAHVGGSYEFANTNNAAGNRWTVWGKIGLSF